MSFTATNIIVGDSTVKTESPPSISPYIPTPSTHLELTDKELEILMLTIKNGLFKGEYVEIIYHLTLKLQKHLVDLKYKTHKL
jgi:hypothetical protein